MLKKLTPKNIMDEIENREANIHLNKAFKDWYKAGDDVEQHIANAIKYGLSLKNIDWWLHCEATAGTLTKMKDETDKRTDYDVLKAFTLFVLERINTKSEKLSVKNVENQTFSKSEKSLVVLLFIWFFLGWLGFDRFYAGGTGNVVAGILKLLLFISGFFTLFLSWIILGIIWLLEVIVIITGGFKDEYGKVIKG